MKWLTKLRCKFIIWPREYYALQCLVVDQTADIRNLKTDLRDIFEETCAPIACDQQLYSPTLSRMRAIISRRAPTIRGSL